jgi:hypothetical protein
MAMNRRMTILHIHRQSYLALRRYSIIDFDALGSFKWYKEYTDPETHETYLVSISESRTDLIRMMEDDNDSSYRLFIGDFSYAKLSNVLYEEQAKRGKILCLL